MEITLEKIELVKDRTGVTYAEAKEALEETDGSVVDAIIAIEETVNAGKKERGFGDKGQALFTSLKDLIKKGNVARIQVKREDDMILNVPLNAGILGICIAPLASIVAVVAAFGFKCKIEVIKTDGTIIDVSDTVSDTVSTAFEKGSDIAEKAKEKSAEFYEKGKAVSNEYTEKLKESEYYGKAKDAADDLQEKADDLMDKAKDAADDLKETADDLKDKAKAAADDLMDKAKDKAEEAEEAAEEAVEEAEEAVEEVGEYVEEEVKDEE